MSTFVDTAHVPGVGEGRRFRRQAVWLRFQSPLASLKANSQKLRMFSLVVLHHNKASYSRACLQSVLRSSARPLEVINVNNGSRDETSDVLREFESEAREVGIEARTLAFEENIGAVRGRNEAVAASSGEFVAFLDNDTLVAQADWLERLAQALQSRSDCALVTPRLLFPWAPFDIECCGAAVSARGRIQYLERGEAGDKPLEAHPIQCAISAAWLLRRSVWNEIGPLDDVFSPVQYEDLDWCYRARERGFSVWTAPETRVFHFEHTTTAGSGDINFGYVTAKNGLEFKKRWSRCFSVEDGPSKAQTQWLDLPKRAIDEVDWRALLP